ncbi:hypothetical protein Tco_1235334 [Tanacetum coccineum]
MSNDENKQADSEKAKEEETGEEQLVDDQVRNVQAEVHVTKPKVKKPVEQLLMLKDQAEIEIQSMVEVLVLQEKQADQRPLLVDTLVTMIRERTTHQPKPPQSQRKTKVEAMSKFNLLEAIDKSVQAHLKKTLPKDVPDFYKIKQEKAAKQYAKSYNTHPAHMKLYDALIDSLLADENDKDKQLDDHPSQMTRRHDDQDPSADVDKETKKRKGAMDDTEMAQDDEMVADAMPHNDDAPTQDMSKWFKQDVMVRPETPDPEWCKEPNANDAPEQPWFNEMVNAEKDSVAFDDLMGSTVDFTKFSKNCLKKDKLTKDDLEGPAFKLLKGNYRNYIELEYNIEQCYLALFDQIDWANPEDLEYLKKGITERKYASSLTKPKAARISVDKQFGYGYLKEIVVRRSDQKEYVFKEADFSKLYLNDIEDMYLLCDNLDLKEPYTILHEPRGVVYLNKNNGKYLMRANELYKFSDGTLNLVRDILNSRLHNFELGYNACMLKRGWTKKDQKRKASMLEKIDQTLLKRRIMRILECFVGGRKIEMDYKLLTRTE